MKFYRTLTYSGVLYERTERKDGRVTFKDKTEEVTKEHKRFSFEYWIMDQTRRDTYE